MEGLDCDANLKLQVNQGAKKLQDRSRVEKFIGKTLIFMTIVSFLFIGLLINILQFILICTQQLSDNTRWKSIHKKAIGFLVHLLVSPPIFLLYYWSRISLNIQLESLELLEDAKKPLVGIMVPNHSYDLDYMICFVLADQLGNLGSYKSMSKDELKYLPVIGWALWMADIVFVKRYWRSDKLIIGDKLNNLLDYDQVLLGLFAEGTRWTPEKQQESEKFALSRGLKPFKHHLVPRSRGFNYTIRHYLHASQNDKRFANKPLRIVNMEILMPDRLRFGDFMEGKQIRADIYCEEVKLDEELRKEVLESKDENDCPRLSKLLLDIYRRKDELVDEYVANGNKFQAKSMKTCTFPYRVKPFSLVVWAIGFITTYGLLFYLAFTRFAQSVTFWSLVFGFVAACFMMLKRIAKESRSNNSIRLKQPEKKEEKLQPCAG